MTIRTRPATEEYRKNFPFPDKSERVSTEPQSSQPPVSDSIGRVESTLVVAPSLLEARQRYMARLGNGGFATIEAARAACTEKSDEVWRVDLRIERVQR